MSLYSNITDYREVIPGEYVYRDKYGDWWSADHFPSEQLTGLPGGPPSTGGATTNTDSGPGEIDLSAIEGLYPRSFSQSESRSTSKTALPDWGSEAVRNYVAQYMTPYSARTEEALRGLENAPELIEQIRQAMQTKYLDTNIRPVISDLASRGVLSSSTAEGALGKVLNEARNAADIWAGTALLSNLADKVSAYQKQMSLLNSLLEAAKASTSESAATSFGENVNPLAPYQLLLPLLLLGGES